MHIPSEMTELIKTIFAVGEQLGCPEKVVPLVKQLTALYRKEVFITISGTITSAFINSLVGFDMLVSSDLPLQRSVFIAAVQEGEQPFVKFNGTRSDLNGPIEGSAHDSGHLEFYLKQPFPDGRNLQLRIIPGGAMLKDDPEMIDDILYGSDIFVFMGDALSLLRRDEIAFLQRLQQMKLSAFIGIAHWHMVGAGDRVQLIQYLKRVITEGGLRSVFFNDCIPDLSGGIEGIYDNIVKELGPDFVGSQRQKLWKNRALGKLFDLRVEVMTRLHQVELRTEDILKEEEATFRAISFQTKEWEALELQLMKKRVKIEESLTHQLSRRRGDMTDALLFELERTQDVKGAWEMDIPHIVNRRIQDIADKVGPSIQREMDEVETWLTASAISIFQHQITIVNKQVQGFPIPIYEPDARPLQGVAQSRINARFIQAAVVLGAGLISASLPIGGISITSIVAGAFSEQFLVGKMRTEKQSIRPGLSLIAEKIELQLLNDFSRKLKLHFEDLLASVRGGQHDWCRGKLSGIRASTSIQIDELDAESLDTLKHKLTNLISHFA